MFSVNRKMCLLLSTPDFKEIGSFSAFDIDYGYFTNLLSYVTCSFRTVAHMALHNFLLLIAPIIIIIFFFFFFFFASTSYQICQHKQTR